MFCPLELFVRKSLSNHHPWRPTKTYLFKRINITLGPLEPLGPTCWPFDLCGSLEATRQGNFRRWCLWPINPNVLAKHSLGPNGHLSNCVEMQIRETLLATWPLSEWEIIYSNANKWANEWNCEKKLENFVKISLTWAKWRKAIKRRMANETNEWTNGIKNGWKICMQMIKFITTQQSSWPVNGYELNGTKSNRTE